MTREEIEKRMDELARKYVEKRDPEIIEELYRLRLELDKLKNSDGLVHVQPPFLPNLLKPVIFR
jgi:FKBP-type peptidyl-prolyl cis-trans isomerase (trigger factor)